VSYDQIGEAGARALRQSPSLRGCKISGIDRARETE
jgi:hypothetical protein